MGETADGRERGACKTKAAAAAVRTTKTWYIQLYMRARAHTHTRTLTSATCCSRGIWSRLPREALAQLQCVKTTRTTCNHVSSVRQKPSFHPTCCCISPPNQGYFFSRKRWCCWRNQRERLGGVRSRSHTLIFLGDKTESFPSNVPRRSVSHDCSKHSL